MTNQFDPCRFNVLIIVSPSHQRQGWGTRLLGHAEAFLKPLDGRELLGSSRANSYGHIAFLTKHGFEEVHRLWESHLTVEIFDPSQFSGALARITQAGITITTLASEQRALPTASKGLTPSTPVLKPTFLARSKRTQFRSRPLPRK